MSKAISDQTESTKEKLGAIKLPRLQIRSHDLDLEEVATALAPYIQLECCKSCGSPSAA